MRRICLVAVVSSCTALAQDGVWTGYVNGWQPTRPSAPLHQTPVVLAPRARPTAEEQRVRQQQQWLLWNAASVAAGQQLVLAQQAELERQRLEVARRELELQEAARAREAATLQQQQQLQNELVLEQQRRVAELERRETERLEKEAAAAREDAARARAALAEKERLDRERELAERERARQEAARQEEARGPSTTRIYRWVDAEGVTHLSTNPPRG